MQAGVVSPVSVSSAGVARSGRPGGMGVNARRAIVLGLTVLLACAAFVALQSEPEPGALEQQWMQKMQKQKQGMSPDQMFMTAIKSGLMAASDANHVAPSSAPSTKLAMVRAQSKTKRLQEVEAAPEVEAARGLWLLRDPCRHTTRQWVSTYRRDSQCQQLLGIGSLTF